MQFVILIALIAAASAQFRTTTTPIPILRQSQFMNPDGSYAYSYETGNGIKVEESGYQKQISATESGTASRGSYSYYAPDGQLISVDWTADENGFQARGAHLPTPPPMPPHVVKMLADLRKAGRL